tara:strand:+ start:67 stop:2589 length:2523 start_codon:yes stop_codon:yes gene_type:complete
LAEQAYAYVTLIPVAKGFQRAIAKELGGSKGVGKTAGKEAGTSFTGGFKRGIGNVAKVAAVAAGVAAAAFGGVLASGFQRLTGIEEAQAKLLGLGNTTEDVALIMDNALSAVRGTAFGMADAATISASAVAAGIKPGQELARYLKITADAAYIAGAGLDEMGSILNKATTSGKAQNDVLNQLADRGIPIYQMLGEQAGVAAGEIFELAKQGEISSDMLINALENKLGGAALESGNTVAGAFANMKASIQRVGANLLGPSFDYFKEFFLGITSFLGPVEEKAKLVGQSISDFLGPAVDNFKRLVGQINSGYLDLNGILDLIIGKITSFFSDGGLDSAFETLSDYRYKIFSAVMEAVPGITDAFVKFLPKLIDFFVNVMLPALLTQAVLIVQQLITVIAELLPDLVKSLLSMVPQLLDAALELFSSLLDALLEVLPVLIDTVVELIPEITQTLLDFLPELVDAAMKLFFGIVKGLVDATPAILDALFDLIPMMIKTLLGAIPEMVVAGAQVIGGFVKGIVTEGLRLVGKAIGSVVTNLVDGAKSLLGIRSPSKVFELIGNRVGEGLAVGIHEMIGPVEDAAKELGNATISAMDDTIEKLETKFTTITNIPSLLVNSVSQAVEISMSQFQRMAEEVEGLFGKFDKAGKLVESYSGFGVENLLNVVGGGQIDVGKLTDSLNSLQKAGFSGVSEFAFGGSTQQALDKILGQDTFLNAKTGQQKVVGGNLSESALADLAAQGFTALPKLDKSVEELTDAIESLNDQVAGKGLTPFATGGFVTGPTPALIGEAGPEVVMPLDRFESMMGLSQGNGGAVNYYAAPNNSIDSEQALFQAMRRAKVVAGW